MADMEAADDTGRPTGYARRQIRVGEPQSDDVGEITVGRELDIQGNGTVCDLQFRLSLQPR